VDEASSLLGDHDSEDAVERPSSRAATPSPGAAGNHVPAATSACPQESTTVKLLLNTQQHLAVAGLLSPA